MGTRKAQRGASVLEMIVAIAIGGMILLIAVPAFRAAIDRSRLDIATRRMTNELMNARSKAITTGWEFKLVGFGSASSDAKRNRYRLLGRRTSAVAWPMDTDAPFTSTTQTAGPWSDPSTVDSSLELLPGGAGANARFEITFDSRGRVSVGSGDFTPFQVRVKGGVGSIRVSVVGGITTQ